MLSRDEIHKKVEQEIPEDQKVFYEIERRQLKMFLDLQLAAQISWIIFNRYMDDKKSKFAKNLVNKTKKKQKSEDPKPVGTKVPRRIEQAPQSDSDK